MMQSAESKIRSRCEGILSTYREEAVNGAFSLIIKLLTNIINKPTDPAIRQFKKTNNTIKTKILIIKECAELMKEIGYVDLDSEFMAYQDEDLANVKTAIQVINDSLEVIKKKLAENEELEEVKRLEIVKRQQDEISRKFQEEKKRKMEIAKQLENDKREVAMRDKPKDSVSKGLEYGAKVCKFEPKKGGGGG